MAENKNKKDSSKNKKKKGNILPVLIVAIVAFLAYKANPEYWQQGRLFEDLKNGGQKKTVETEDVAKKPESNKPDPDLIYDGSIKDSKTIPRYVKKAVNKNDPTYYVFRSKYKTLYLVYPDGAAGKKIVADITDGIKKRELRDDVAVASLLYTPKDKKTKCESSVPLQFLCEQCDKKICIVNPKKNEFLVVSPSAQSALSRVAALVKSGEWDEK